MLPIFFILGIGIGTFFGAWRMYNKYPEYEKLFLNLGNLGFWLIILSLIFLIWG